MKAEIIIINIYFKFESKILSLTKVPSLQESFRTSMQKKIN